MHCLICDKDFTPRGLPVLHGTIEGFNRHNRRRSGQWGWPACDKCLAGRLAWRREYDARPESVKARKIRTAARATAFEALRRQYPAAYAAAYRRELELRGAKEVRQRFEVPDWESILDKLVYAALGVTETEMEHKTSSRLSVMEQREVVVQIRRLRILLAKRYQDSNVHGRKAS
jgi:hypothetical protein